MASDTDAGEGNPLEPSADHEERIRQRAYHLWEAEGRLEGRDSEYWERARELEAISSSSGAGLMPANKPDRPEEAALQENLGEFPGRFADQGEERPTPMARSELAHASE